MRHLTSESADSYLNEGVKVVRWEQFSLGDTMPFQAMWYTVPPTSSTPQDYHPEVELSVVLSGTASVEASGEITDVGPGESFLLSSKERHIIHNRTDEPCVVFTTFWMPRETADSAAGSGDG
jgi:quercetin dioxygenase-like cupin family protein